MKYFEGLTQEKEIKDRFKTLAKEHHPDLGGNADTMKAINLQYESVLRGAYQTAGKTLSEIDELLKNDLLASQAVSMIATIQDITIEICGNWVWITGQTKQAKEILKTAKFRYASKKKAWYWRPPDYARKFYKKRYSLNDIRDTYGSYNVKAKPKAKIQG